MASGFNGTLYVGVTSDLTRRVARHRDAAPSSFTGRYHIHHLAWFELTETMEAAILSEKRMKKWPRDWKKNLIERDNPLWQDPAVTLGLQPLA